MVSIDTGLPDGIYDYYLFRFERQEPHWAAKDGGLPVSPGPTSRMDQPTTASLGDTFSTFTKWDAKTPENTLGYTRTDEEVEGII